MGKKKDEMLNDLMTYSDVTDEMKVNRSTVQYWVKRGLLAPIKLGYAVFFRRKDVEKIKRKREERNTPTDD